MAKVSAGLLMYKKTNEKLEVFLVHPGGPFFAKRDDVWGIPKGEQNDKENLLETAKREFSEETGIKLNESTTYSKLGSTTYSTGKVVYAWAFEDGNFDPKNLVCNLTSFGWPEVDRGEYFDIETARQKMYLPQQDFLDRLANSL